jgi:hypothetical protein
MKMKIPLSLLLISRPFVWYLHIEIYANWIRPVLPTYAATRSCNLESAQLYERTGCANTLCMLTAEPYKKNLEGRMTNAEEKVALWDKHSLTSGLN